MARAALVKLVAALVIAAACGPAPSRIARTAGTAGCGREPPAPAGTSARFSVAVDPSRSLGQPVRSYRLHVPQAASRRRPSPLLLVFHGRGGTGEGAESSTGFSRLSDRRAVIVAYPDGLQAPDHSGSFWSTRGTLGVDDADFVSLVIDRIERDLCVDPSRVYVAGFSNGGGFVITLACRLAQRVAAVVSIAGYFFEPPGGCHPQRPVSILEVHGDADDNVVYNGLPAEADAPALPALPAVPVWLGRWAEIDGCHATPEVFAQTPQLVGERWTGCRAGAEIVHYKLAGFGHAIPMTLAGRPFEDVAWDFFQRHPLK